MPFYEFYCADCHTVYNFYARRVTTDRTPACPGCGGGELQRQVSLFSVSKGRGEDAEEGDDPLGDIDETRMEQAMASLESEIENVDENDPRQIGRVMRGIYEATGLQMAGGMEEAVRRMEAGEDPDRIDEELGDAIESEDPFASRPKKGLRALRRQLLPPRVDKTLYEM